MPGGGRPAPVGRLLHVTVSMGGVRVPGGSLSVQESIRLADQALHTAKDAGRDRVVIAGTAVQRHLEIA